MNANEFVKNLGLEKCKAIVDSAPEWAVNFCMSNDMADTPYTDETEGSCDFCIYLDYLRTAIADHERTDNCTDIRNHISNNTKVIER